MAKWGEGDPRWVVEEREDGTNANNWHWTEKNATAWSKKTLTSLLVGLTPKHEAAGEATLTEVDSITGDCIANCRKGKLIFFYELVIKMKWKGKTADGTIVNGTLEIPNLSEEQDIEDIDVNVTLTSDNTSDRRKVKDLVRKAGADLIRDQLTKWLDQLKTQYAADLIKPTKGKAAGGGAGAGAPPAKVGVKLSETVKVVPKPKPVAAPKVSYKTIKLTDDFKCRGEDLFKALITEDLVKAYTSSDSKVDSKVGGEFTLFGGNVSGVFKEIVPYTKITQAWRMKSWPSGHFSDVTLEIEEKKDKVVLTLTQSGVPESEVESVKGGWRSNQWARMKGILGFGSGIMGGF